MLTNQQHHIEKFLDTVAAGMSITRAGRLYLLTPSVKATRAVWKRVCDELGEQAK